MTERGTWVKFGWIPFRLRPLTLAQIWEIGEEISKCGMLELTGTFNAVEVMLSRHEDVRRLQRVIIIALFRSRVMRRLCGWWIRWNTTMERYERVIDFCARSFSAPFFSKYDFPKRSKGRDDEYARSTSPWGFIGGIMKYFRMSYEEVVFRRSYLNLMLLNAAIPGMKPHDEEDGDEDGYKAPRNKRHGKSYNRKDNGNSFFSTLM